MKARGRRVLLGCGTLVLAAALVLAGLEWNRRRQAATAVPPSLGGPGAAVSARELEERYRAPEAFAALCADVREHADAMQQRFYRLQHTRKTRLTRYDSKGQVVAVSEAVYHVRFRNGAEQRTEVERRQLQGQPSFFDPDKIKLDQNDSQMTPPFSKSEPEGLYAYRLEGVEELGGRKLLRVGFEPTRPADRSFRGSAWIDPDSHEPARLRASLAKARLSVDHFDMLLDYGPSENGHNQLRHAVMDMAGGFALVSLHYRVESELSDYRADDE